MTTAVADMKRVRVKYKTEDEWLDARTQDLTSSDISALFGASTYKTAFELWHEKAAGERVEIDETDNMKWGNRFEHPIALGVAEDQGWKIRRFKTYIRIPELRLGSSFDYRILGKPKRIFEVKNVNQFQFGDNWIVDGEYIEAPPYIEFQVQHQMLVPGMDQTEIAAMVGGSDVRMVHRDANLRVHEAILTKAAAFWKSIDEGRVPTPDFRRDGKVLARMAIEAFEPGKLKDATEDAAIEVLCRQISDLGSDVKGLTEDRDAFRAELLTLIGDAERVLVNGYNVSCGLVGESVIKEHTRKPYRNLRVTKKKVKKGKG